MLLKRGQIVKSIAGHDKNRFYVVVNFDKANNRVLLADGKYHSYSEPKAKNPEHVAPTKRFCRMAWSYIPTDKHLRAWLHSYNFPQQSPNEITENHTIY